MTSTTEHLFRNENSQYQQIRKLIAWESMTKEDLEFVLKTNDKNIRAMVESEARTRRDAIYGNRVYIRGLIEISNYCTRSCNYCGIRRQKKLERYRLSLHEILNTVDYLVDHDITTIVLQGGEDPYFTDEVLTDLIRKIKGSYPQVAVTLSLGEKSKESYQKLKAAGADRYLLRHETATKEHYEYLHPEDMSFEERMNCLKTLKQIGFQTGAGMMIGSPKQEISNLVNDLLFLKQLSPEMIGIGPFIAASNTPFQKETSGTVKDATLLVSLARILVPNALIPATTALQSLDANGYLKGILAGANVVMINVSPLDQQGKYQIYNNKLKSEKSLKERLNDLKEIIKNANCVMDLSVGHYQEDTNGLVKEK